MGDVVGKRWAEHEKSLLIKMYAEDCSVGEIVDRLPGRSVAAVHQQVLRLGLKRGSVGPTKENFIVPPIQADEAMSREEALNILSSIMRTLEEGGKVGGFDFDRMRIFITAIRNYFAVFDSYEKYTELEERVKRLEDVSDQEDKEAASRRKTP